jgi:hypothetical protein
MALQCAVSWGFARCGEVNNQKRRRNNARTIFDAINEIQGRDASTPSKKNGIKASIPIVETTTPPDNPAKCE